MKGEDAFDITDRFNERNEKRVWNFIGPYIRTQNSALLELVAILVHKKEISLASANIFRDILLASYEYHRDHQRADNVRRRIRLASSMRKSKPIRRV